MNSKLLTQRNPRYKFNDSYSHCVTNPEHCAMWCDPNNRCEIEYDEYTEYDHLPKFMSSRQCVRQESYELSWYYKRGWDRMTGNLRKINPEALLGMHVDDVVSKYIHRLRGEYHHPAWVLDLIGIYYARRNKKGTLLFIGPRSGYVSFGGYKRGSGDYTYYAHPRTGIIKRHFNDSKGWRPHYDAKKWYEDRAQRRKARREARKAKEDNYPSVIKLALMSHKKRMEWEERRRREADLRNLQNIERHGFDPLTSFRNH